MLLCDTIDLLSGAEVFCCLGQEKPRVLACNSPHPTPCTTARGACRAQLSYLRDLCLNRADNRLHTRHGVESGVYRQLKLRGADIRRGLLLADLDHYSIQTPHKRFDAVQPCRHGLPLGRPHVQHAQLAGLHSIRHLDASVRRLPPPC